MERELAKRTFETMASVYDDFTADYDYEGWLADLLKILESHGLAGRRLLDVACGTGKSFLPLLPRGWQVTGCDLSPAMLSLAKEKVDESIELSTADMRELPKFGEFDLVWCLDDAINFLFSPKELVDALKGMQKNLSADGLLLFDVNELLAFRTSYAETTVVEQGGVIWRGQGSADIAAGPIWEARLEVVSPQKADNQPLTIIHRQRHFPEADIVTALEQAGLEPLGIYGHGLDGIPVQPLDLSIHTKAIYVARLSRPATVPHTET